MSGTASRYIAGVPYGPGRSVGRYPTRASAATTPGVVNVPGAGVLGDGGAGAGGVVAPQVTAANMGGGGGGGDGMNLLLMAAGLLPMLPSIYDTVSDWLSPAAQAADLLPTPPEFLTPEQAYDLPRTADNAWAPDATVAPWGLPVVPFGGSQFGYVPPGSSPWSPAGGQSVIWDPTNAAGRLGQGGNGWVYPGDVAGGSAGAGAAAGAAANAANFGPGLLESGALGSVGPFDVGTTAAALPLSIMGGIAGNTFGRGGNEQGAQIGTAAGGAASAALGGAAALGLISLAPWAALPLAFALPAMGGAIGSQIGPQPTIGRNFSTIGTFGGDGNIYWGQGGGDNGGTADDANAFANWFGPNLLQQAASQGLAFNPAMEGVQFNIGGYDQWSRNPNLGGVGGFFYDPYLGGSPENYALRPNANLPGAGLFNALAGPGFTPDQAFGADQSGAFTNAVLGDLTARGVFTQAGAAQPGRDFYDSAWGAPLGSYAPGMGFGDAYGATQGAIGGWQAGTDLRAQAPDYEAEQGARFEVHLEKARGVMGADAAPFEAKLVETAEGGLTWVYADLAIALRDRAEELLRDGISVRDVAEETGMSKSAVHRLKKRLDAEAGHGRA